ncbi:STAS/SEC14 domain-containing protein [Micromonospora sp. LOL_023]|uniref:STAS/SEC14 domain-containing protein n=1 Tax=Micromonospora sp. LOL_023 TaxID=3345418 RepID=UPI003A8C6323
MITKIGQEGNVLGYEVAGKLTEQEHQDLYRELREMIAEYGSISVLGRLPDDELPGMQLAAIDDRLRFARDHLTDIDRTAVVGGTRTAEWVTRACDTLTPIEIRHFDAGAESQAWDWLRRARPV